MKHTTIALAASALLISGVALGQAEAKCGEGSCGDTQDELVVSHTGETVVVDTTEASCGEAACGESEMDSEIEEVLVTGSSRRYED